MKVWIVNPFDNLPSEGNRPQRYYLMAQAFVRAGHKVVYWTSDFSHATKRKRVRLRDEVEKGIEIVEIPTLPYEKNICPSRVKSHRKLARDFEKMAKSRLSVSTYAPNLVIASAPPLGLCAAAMRVAHQCGAKFVCDIQDAWPETFERILPRFVWTVLGMRKTAKELYCGADGVSAVAERYLELAKEYGCGKPMHLAGHVLDAVRGEREEQGAIRERVAGERGCVLRLVYAGNMSLSYDLETVIRAVQDLPNVTLDIAGNGPDLRKLEAKVEGEGRNIRFHGYLGEEDLSELLMNCDVGLIPMFPESCVGVPGKMADYAATHLSVIESLGGECEALLRKFGAGVHYTAGDADSLKAAIASLSSTSASNYNPSAFASQFDAKRVMDAYVRWSTEELK